MSVSLVVILLFILVCSVLGYKIISAVPPLLHTPLMSGMNALSGITLLAALASLKTGGAVSFFSLASVVLATINVVGGYWVTERMLSMFKQEGGKEAER